MPVVLYPNLGTQTWYDLKWFIPWSTDGRRLGVSGTINGMFPAPWHGGTSSMGLGGLRFSFRSAGRCVSVTGVCSFVTWFSASSEVCSCSYRGHVVLYQCLWWLWSVWWEANVSGSMMACSWLVWKGAASDPALTLVSLCTDYSR